MREVMLWHLGDEGVCAMDMMRLAFMMGVLSLGFSLCACDSGMSYYTQYAMHYDSGSSDVMALSGVMLGAHDGIRVYAKDAGFGDGAVSEAIVRLDEGEAFCVEYRTDVGAFHVTITSKDTGEIVYDANPATYRPEDANDHFIKTDYPPCVRADPGDYVVVTKGEGVTGRLDVYGEIDPALATWER